MAHEFFDEPHKKLVAELELSALAVRQAMSSASSRGHEAHVMAHLAAFVTKGDLDELEEAIRPFEQRMHDIWVEGNETFGQLNYAIVTGGGQIVEHPNLPLSERASSSRS